MKTQLKTYIIEFVHCKTNQPQQLAFDAYTQFEALQDFKKTLGTVNFKNCNFSNFNMRALLCE